MPATAAPQGGTPEVYRHFTQMDATTGNYATMAILMALLAREKTGKGQRIDLNMVEAAQRGAGVEIGEYLATGEQPPLLGSGHARRSCPAAPSRQKTAPGSALQAMTLPQWQGLCSVLGLTDLAENEAYNTIAGRVAAREAINDALAATLKTKPSRWWQLKLGQASVPCARIMRFEELMQSPAGDAEPLHRAG